MRIFLCLVSDNKVIRDIVSSAKGSIVPKTFRETESVKAIAPSFNVCAAEFADEFSVEKLILEKLAEWDGVCLLTDDPERLSWRLRTSCFVGKVGPDPGQEMDLTRVIAIATRVLANYFNLFPYLQDKGSRQALALPLENFDAEELRNLILLFCERGADHLFLRSFTGLLAKLRKRNMPKRPKGDDPKRYFQDDQEKHFDYGPEDHGQFDTATPHTELCELSGNFRFGWKIPANRHFNMTKVYKKKTWIKGDFPGCHGQLITIPGQSHVNIFPNDFHKPK